MLDAWGKDWLVETRFDCLGFSRRQWVEAQVASRHQRHTHTKLISRQSVGPKKKMGAHHHFSLIISVVLYLSGCPFVSCVPRDRSDRLERVSNITAASSRYYIASSWPPHAKGLAENLYKGKTFISTNYLSSPTHIHSQTDTKTDRLAFEKDTMSSIEMCWSIRKDRKDFLISLFLLNKIIEIIQMKRGN